MPYKAHQASFKKNSGYFTPPAQLPGLYKNKGSYNHCLPVACQDENFFAGIRANVLSHLSNNKITLHSPNNMVSSQVFCFNALFPYINLPNDLRTVLKGVGYNVKQLIPVSQTNGKEFIRFEWVSSELNEPGTPTTVDFMFLFEQEDGKNHLVLGEWKYSETGSVTSKAVTKNRTNRIAIYQNFLQSSYCQIINNIRNTNPEAFFYEPFYQMMRLQLLASEIEQNGFRSNLFDFDGKIDIVSVLVIVPWSNDKLINTVTSHLLAGLGISSNVFKLWMGITQQGRFKIEYWQNGSGIKDSITKNVPANYSGIAHYLKDRYV